MEIEAKVKGLVEKTIQDNGYTLYGVEYVKESGNYYLRVVIDKENGVDVDDCVKISKLINPIIDEIDFIEDSYILDVCSKGVE